MSDLRRSAIEVKREHDQKAKWAHGSRSRSHAPAGSNWAHRAVEPVVPVLLRPAAPVSQSVQSALKRGHESGMKRARHAAHVGFQHDVKEALTSDSSSSSADEAMPHHESTAPNALLFLAGADDDLAAYDVSGQNVLSAAISSAEAKYENKVTEKLVKEYELVTKDEEAATAGYVADIDDFEVIDHVSV